MSRCGPTRHGVPGRPTPTPPPETRPRSARAWELRAATSLARLWAEQGRRAEARDLLARISGWFTEGFDTADLIEAKAVLDAPA